MKFYYLILLAVLFSACQTKPKPVSTNYARNSAGNSGVPVYTYEVVNTFKHDSKAFTEGLFFHDGVLYESTGLKGKSDLRKTSIEDGIILQKVALPTTSFGEGIALFNDKIYQLTYREGVCRVFDASSFQFFKEFNYSGQGWGLTHDDKNLIMSDGTHIIRFINPENFQTERTITVFNEGKPLMNLNELELIKGELWANVWHSDNIVRIDPNTGKILGWIDLNGLSPADTERDPENTLNGIAFDPATDRIFVTGKNWRQLFELKIKPQQ